MSVVDIVSFASYGGIASRAARSAGLRETELLTPPCEGRPSGPRAKRADRRKRNDMSKSSKVSKSSKEFDKRIQSSYSLGSTEDAKEDDKDDEDIARELRGKNLAHIFTEEHANLTSVIMVLMEKRGMDFLVQEKLLKSDDAYWETGEYTPDELDLVSINAMLLVAAGRVQQVTIAGLQILYEICKNGPKNEKGNNYSVRYKSNKEKNISDIHIGFKFNQQPVNLAIQENGDASYMSLYIED